MNTLTITRACIVNPSNPTVIKPQRGTPRRIELRQEVYSDGVVETWKKVVPGLVAKGARTSRESIADLIPLHWGNWIGVIGDQFVGVELGWEDPRVQIKPREDEVDLNNPWDAYIVDFAKSLIFEETKAMARNGDPAGLMREGTDFIQDRHFPDGMGYAPTLIPGFGNLDVCGGALFVPFFRNGTTLDKFHQLESERGRYTMDLGGARSHRRKIHGMWAARLWDRENDHEVIGSRFYSWDLESTVSAVALVAEGLETEHAPA